MLLRGARIVTMKGDEVIERGDIYVRNNRIAAVGATGTLTGVPADVRVIDVTGKTIMPGFVDTHAHPDVERGEHQQPWSYLVNLAYGVTTMRDPQTGTTDVLTYEDAVTAGSTVGPRIYSTGPGLFASTYVPAAGEEINNLDDARRILRRYSQYYDTHTLKMYLAGNRQQRQWIVMAAKEQNIMPTTEGALDFRYDMTMAMDGYPGQEHNIPITPLYKDVVSLMSQTRHRLHADADRRLRRAARRELLVRARAAVQRREDAALHALRGARVKGASSRPQRFRRRQRRRLVHGGGIQLPARRDAR